MFDEGGFARDISAAAGERFAEGAHPDVHAGTIEPKVFAYAFAGGAHDSEGMGLIDHQKRAVLVLDFDEAGQVGIIPVHAIDAFEDNEHSLELSALLREQRIELGPVVVGERHALRPRDGDALQDAVVNERVVQD